MFSEQKKPAQRFQAATHGVFAGTIAKISADNNAAVRKRLKNDDKNEE
ncbi:hypothetical protein OU798_19570 [Prolixibacteraceae bacterium Z1-6]|uniref:Uncharacterized protein n=1 Tax=Draconibacterium aestuarii TaxID=2998507 RepID=A0A9X3FH39_9BACT|nr:hypothetical protein [Prolixibacteraceae bacterium Z1-6]